MKDIPGTSMKVAMNRLGYHEHTDRSSRTASYVRRLRNLPYPRFHVYIESQGDGIVISVHLDEKQPSYGTTPRHSGQYDSDIVQQEAARIQTYLTSL